MGIATVEEAIDFLKSLKTLHVNGDTSKSKDEEIINIANDIYSLNNMEG